MIAVYNETNKPWEVHNVNKDGSVISFSKPTQYKTPKGVKRNVAHIIGYRSLFRDSKFPIEERLKRSVLTRRATTLSKCSTALIYSKKDFKPFITERQSANKNIFLISINLRRRQLIELGSERLQSFVLDAYIASGTLNLIVSLNTPEEIFNIKLYDQLRGSIDNYSFWVDSETGNGFSKVFFRTLTVEEKKTFVPARVNLEIFRPKKPTELVIIKSEYDRKDLLKMMDTSHNNIVLVTRDDIDNQLQNLVTDNYKAVTLFVNNDDYDSVKKYYGGILKKLLMKFNTVHVLLNNNRVIHMK